MPCGATARSWNAAALRETIAAGSLLPACADGPNHWSSTMKLRLLAVGRAGSKRPELALIEEYRQRLTWPLTIQEVEEKRPLPSAALKKREGELLLAALGTGKTGSGKA